MKYIPQLLITTTLLLFCQFTYGNDSHLAYVFSIPKSGSFYIRSILKNLTGNECEQTKYIEKSQISTYHLIEHFHQRPNHHISIPQSVINREAKHHKKIILIRNLRDVLFSELRMCDGDTNTIPWHFDKTCKITPSKNFWNRASQEVKIKYILNHSVLRQDVEICLNLLKKKNILVIRFEDLLTSAHGGNDTVASSTIQTLKAHLNITSEIDPIDLLNKSWGKGRTFLEGRKTHPFDSSTKNAFKKAGWNYLNNKLGYN